MTLLESLQSRYSRATDHIFSSGREGYWSNLTRTANATLTEALKTRGAREALILHQPHLEDVVYSPKREAGLELLQLSGNETCIDYGCMWGALTLPLAKRTAFVLGVDQTMHSLEFVEARTKEEQVHNVALLCADLRSISPFDIQTDIAIVNGVLEWIPEHGEVELTQFYGQFQRRSYAEKPIRQQLRFLKTVFDNLKPGGQLYLAIENRYDFKMFLGVKDPHSGLPLTSLLPRSLSSMISNVILGRPYVNWLYSFSELRSLLNSVGFSTVKLYMCFPDYRFPEIILPYESQLTHYQLTIPPYDNRGRRTLKRKAARAVEYLVFKKCRGRFFTPSIVAIATK